MAEMISYFMKIKRTHIFYCSSRRRRYLDVRPWYININIYYWTFPIEIPRKYEVILTRIIRIGHTKISHMHRGKTPNFLSLRSTSHHKIHINRMPNILYQHQNNHNLPESTAEILDNHLQSITNIVISFNSSSPPAFTIKLKCNYN